MPKSKFEEIYRSLKRKVERGDYPTGELMPSENTLVGVYGCSRNTVRRAIAGLIEDGYVQAVHGKGVQVIYQKASRAAFTVGSIESFQETSQRNRLHSVTKVVVFERVTADEAFAAESGFAQGTELWHVERVRVLDSKALILDVNYLRRDQMPGLTADIAAGSLYTYLEKELGMQIVTSKRTITVERADDRDRELLDLDGYDCLAVVSSHTFNADGVMFEYTRSRHQPGYFSFQDTATRRR